MTSGPTDPIRRGSRAWRWILVGFLLLPVVELATAIQVAHRIGAGPTVALVATGCLAGLIVLRREGAGAARDLRAARATSASGRTGSTGRTVDPEGALVTPAASGRSGPDRLLVLLAGLLLVVPGLITDLFGALLLVPPVRRGVAALVRNYAQATARRLGWTAGGARVVRDVRDDESPGPAAGPGLER